MSLDRRQRFTDHPRQPQKIGDHRCITVKQGYGDYVVTTQATAPRWATRKEAIQYSKVGSTKFSELVRDRRIIAKRLDARKLIIDLNSIDQLYECLPSG
jgi:hypothetical protein